MRHHSQTVDDTNSDDRPNRLHHWLAVSHRPGALFTLVGAVTLVAAIMSPTYAARVRRRVVERDEAVS